MYLQISSLVTGLSIKVSLYNDSANAQVWKSSQLIMTYGLNSPVFTLYFTKSDKD